MTDYGQDLLFGCFLSPDAGASEQVVELAQLADGLGLDLLGVQDHPYQPGFLDMWTLLSALARITEQIRLVPDVANLPLRPPAVLAGAAASLDILSGGRVEMGLGSGAFRRAIEAIGGPGRTPGESVEALAEGITIIRGLWTPGPPVTFAGDYYTVRGAQPGPFPAHPIEIWLGAYKPRMLGLTGSTADGWIPTLAYAAPDELGAMSATIDEAARAAGRDPSSIRRVYNIAGRFTAMERGYLEGPAELWVAQLTDLALEHGISAFLLAPGQDAAADLQRFAADVAPAVRETVAAARRPRARTEPPAPALPAEVRSAASAPASSLLDESARPHLPQPENAPTNPAGLASRQTLLQVHDHLRQELAEILKAADQVASGRLTPAAARSLINQMTIRQNYWTLGAFCAQYCRVVTIHHTIEDRHMFPALRTEDEALTSVLDRLSEEHEIIAAVLDRFDRTLGAMVSGPDGVDEVRGLAEELAGALLSHFAYEEQELLGPLGRSSIVV